MLYRAEAKLTGADASTPIVAGEQEVQASVTLQISYESVVSSDWAVVFKQRTTGKGQLTKNKLEIIWRHIRHSTFIITLRT